MRRSLCSVLAAVTVAVATLPRATAFTAPAALTRAFGGQAAAMSPGRLIRGSGANAVALGRAGLRGRAGGLQLRMREVGSTANAIALSVPDGTITCKAAVAYGPGQKLVVEGITVEPPRKGEVRVKLTACALCHTDAYTLSGDDPEGIFPSILGHEGGGVVESIGEGVTSVAVGDHVIPLYTPECGDCMFCASPKTNLCVKIRATQGKGLMPDGTVRYRNMKGEPLFHFMGCSCFSQYVVCADISLAKITKEADLNVACLLGCGVTTGIGAALNTAKVEEGSSCAVFGLGAVGLAVIYGCKQAGAERIFAVDINPEKFEMARQMGATDCVNPKDHTDPIQQVLVGMSPTGYGIDNTFECVGRVETMRAALEASHRGWGKSVVIGVAGSGQEIATRPFQLVTGRQWMGTAFGGYKSRTAVPLLVDKYVSGEIPLESFITHRMKLDDINEAFTMLHDGDCLRCVIDMT